MEKTFVREEENGPSGHQSQFQRHGHCHQTLQASHATQPAMAFVNHSLPCHTAKVRAHYKSRQKAFSPGNPFFKVASAGQWESRFSLVKIDVQKGKPNMATAKKAPAKDRCGQGRSTGKEAHSQRSLHHEGPHPSPALAAVVGSAPLPRTEIISKLWVYIKANNPQDATNKRNINADAKELFFPCSNCSWQTSACFHVRTVHWPVVYKHQYK